WLFTQQYQATTSLVHWQEIHADLNYFQFSQDSDFSCLTKGKIENMIPPIPMDSGKNRATG
ncbi:MAG TPA: hypothetical protein PLZ55_04630, partial [bacterium]|nr:hypothetical protein [bacterium]